MLGNFRYAIRTLLKSPGFALIAVVTLALGIGANTAIFSVANALLLKPLDYASPEGLVMVYAARPDVPRDVEPYSYPRFEFMRDRSQSFSGLSAFTDENFNLTGRGDPVQLSAARVSANFFDVLGVRPAAGRVFRPEEERQGATPVCIVSHALWTRSFGARSDAVGQKITLDATPYTVIGVLPREFEFASLGTVDLWTPGVYTLNLLTPEHVRAGAGFLKAVGRLKTGVSEAQAQAEMDVLTRQFQQENPRIPDADPKLRIRAQNLLEQTVDNVRTAVLILSGAVGLLLLIACANVAALLLSRALARGKEIAIRAALGADRRQLIAQLLLESTILAMAGGALGLALSIWGTPALTALAQGNFPRAGNIGVDGRVLAFALLLSLATGILFGLLPALRLSRPDLNPVLHAEGRGSSGGPGRNRARQMLVAGQVALSMVLLVGASLLIRSFVLLRSVNPGVDPANVLTMNISLPPARYATSAQMVAFYDQAVKQVDALPGVRSAAIAAALPVKPVRFSPVLMEGQPEVPLPARPVVAIQMVTPDYFKTLRVALRKGRIFTEHDDAGAPMVVVINETLAHRYWPNENPVGKHVLLGRMTKPAEVVGVAADVNNLSLALAPEAEIYLSYPQRPWATMNLLVRTVGDPHGLVSAVRAAVLSIDRDQPVTAVASMDEVLADSTAQQRFSMVLLAVFSSIALILAAVGLYGAISYSVVERTREMGIRLALGAAEGDLLRLVIGQGLALTLAGLAVGALAAAAVTRLMSGMLFKLHATDPLSFATSAAVFVAIAALASYLPARRATRVDPLNALRHD